MPATSHPPGSLYMHSQNVEWNLGPSVGGVWVKSRRWKERTGHIHRYKDLEKKGCSFCNIYLMLFYPFAYNL